MTVELKEVAADKGGGGGGEGGDRRQEVLFFASEPLVDSLWSDNASGNDKQYFLRGISKEKAERGESK